MRRPEEGEREAEEEGGGDGERYASKGDGDGPLHGGGPPAFCSNKVDKGAPEGFDNPWQIKPACIEGDVGVGDAKTLVHDDGDGHHGNVRQTFSKIEGRDPCPRIDVL